MLPTPKKCVMCHGPIEGRHAGRDAKYCSDKCRRSGDLGRFLERNKKSPEWVAGIGTAKVGAIHEMIACAELLKRDLSVFRAISACETCDLIAMRDRRIIRVEVTTAYRGATGKLMHTKAHKKERFDLLVLVEKDGTVTFEPSISEAFERTQIKCQETTSSDALLEPASSPS